MMCVHTGVSFKHLLITAGFLLLMLVVKGYSANEPFRGQCLRTGNFRRVLKDRILPNHVIDTRKVTCSLDCVFECLSEPRCSSINYEEGDKVDHVCELNGATAATTAELVNKSGYSYYHPGENPSSCASFPCANGGTCVDPCSTTAQARTCICGPDNYGDSCQFTKALGDFDIEFKKGGSENYVELDVDRNNITIFTASVWLRTTANASSTIFSYTTASEAKELIFACQEMQSCQFVIGGESRNVYTPPLDDNLWHHVVVSWENEMGHWDVMIDGAVRGRGKMLKKAYVIPGRGRLVLGKSQGIVGGSSFVGLLSEFNWFNGKVPPEFIKKLSTICKIGLLPGDMVRWQDFIPGIRGNVQAKWPSICSGVSLEATFALRFPASDSRDYVEAPTFPSLNRFTLCLWMKTPKKKFAILSYVLPESRALWYRLSSSGHIRLTVMECGTTISLPFISDNVWHHVCISWENVQGKVQFFLDGVLRKVVTEFCVGVTIPGGGVVRIGQYLENINETGNPTMTFVGELSHVNMWSSVLHEGTVGALSKDRGSESGDVISWKLVLPLGKGNVEVTSTPLWEWKKEEADYDLKFPRRSTTDYALFKDMQLTLHQLTICLWMKTMETGVLFSYAVPEHYNALYAELGENSIFFNINALPRRRHEMRTEFLRDGSWHHICFTWQNFDGQWCMYIDSNQTLCKAGYKTGEKINASGMFIVGQKQDELGSNFTLQEAFVGELSQVNVWGTSYSQEVIALMFRSRGHWHGAVVSWESFKYNVNGDATIIKPSSWIRHDYVTDYDLFIASKTVTDFARSDSMPTLKSFTVCLWMKTSASDTVLALFSYATPEKADALTLRLVNTNNLQVKINNEIASDDSVASVNLRDDTWHHLCATWESVNGTNCLFIDGFKSECSDHAQGQSISGGGSLMIGQHQDSYGGSLTSEEAFSGLLSKVNVWNLVHPGDFIRDMLRVPDLCNGNALSWSQLRNDVRGAAKILTPSSCTRPAEQNDYELKFPTRTVTDSVVLAPPPSPPSLTNLSMCWWMKTIDDGTLTPVSILAEAPDTAALTVMVYGSKANFYMKEDKRSYVLTSPFRDDKWHHFCFTWRSSDGRWYLYFDGRQATTGDSFCTGSKVRMQSLVLGQEQDSFGGGFEADQAFVGVLSGFNIWSTEYTAYSIKRLAQGCGRHRGTVVAWADFRTKVRGGVEVTVPATCGAEGVIRSDFDVKFDRQSASDYAMFESMPTLTALTTCLWMKSTNSEIRPLTMFSYSSASDNPDAIVMSTRNSTLTFTINNLGGGDFALPAPGLLDGAWHHMCVRWRKSDGELYLFVDGVTYGSSQPFAKDQTIDGGGKLILGQEQDTFGGGFNTNEMFNGVLSQVNVWDYMLSYSLIWTMSRGGWPWTGNVVSWRDFRNDVRGDATVVSSQSRAMSVPTTFQESDFDLLFQSRTAVDHALLFMSSSQSLHELTICLWLKTNDAGKMALFSYATTAYHNALYGGLDNNDFDFSCNTNTFKTLSKKGSFNLRDGAWHHVCFTWENVNGKACVLVDGVEGSCLSQYQTGEFLPGDGIFVIGQDQDKKGGNFDASQALVGRISRVNLWDAVVDTEFIWEMSHGCGMWIGNVIAWRYPLMTLHGHAAVLYPSECTLPVATVMERRDKFCKDKHGTQLVLFDRKKEQEGKLWRCYRSSTLKQVPYIRGFAYDEAKLATGLFTENNELSAIQD